MNSGGSNNVSLKYERFASSGCDLGIIKLGFVAKTQFPFARIQIYIEKTKKWTKYKEGSLQNFTLFCSSKARNLKYDFFFSPLHNQKKSVNISLRTKNCPPFLSTHETSTTLPFRFIHISGFEGFQIWPLMSTHYWGENPTGNWTLTIRYIIFKN